MKKVNKAHQESSNDTLSPWEESFKVWQFQSLKFVKLSKIAPGYYTSKENDILDLGKLRLGIIGPFVNFGKLAALDPQESDNYIKGPCV